MGKVVADMSMSLDGFIADPQDGVGELFGWYGSGDVEVPTADERWSFKVSAASAEHLRPAFTGGIGALLAGRRIFDQTQGWGGRHPTGAPVFVVSHSVPEGWPRADSATTFYDDALVALAAAKEAAGDKIVAVFDPEDGSTLELEFAYRVARMRVTAAREGSEDIDAAAVRATVARAVAAMDDVRKIKSQLTSAQNGIGGAKELLDVVEARVRAELDQVDAALAAANDQAELPL